MRTRWVVALVLIVALTVAAMAQANSGRVPESKRPAQKRIDTLVRRVNALEKRIEELDVRVAEAHTNSVDAMGQADRALKKQDCVKGGITVGPGPLGGLIFGATGPVLAVYDPACG